MKSNLDVWAIQYYPNELFNVLSNLKAGMNIIYSNCVCSLNIGSQNIESRQFDTFLYNEDSDTLVMLMRGGFVTKNDIIKFLEANKKEYTEVTFTPFVNSYEDGDNIPELWFAREQYVLNDALQDSKVKNISSCEFYPNIEGSLELGYITNLNDKIEVDGRLFKGLVKLDDKLVLIINQTVDKNNLLTDDILKIINEQGFNCDVILEKEPNLYVENFSKTLKK